MALLSKEEALQDLATHYTRPPHPVAYSGVAKIAKHYKGALTETEVERFLLQYDTFTLHRETKRPSRFTPIFVRATREMICADLATFHDMGKHNRGYNYLLVACDGFSRRLFCAPLKSKSAIEVQKGLESLVNKEIGVFDKLVTDAGKEWDNAIMREYLTKIGSRWIYPRTSGKSLLAERLISTLKAIIAKYCTFHNTLSFIDALDHLKMTYNHSWHRGINDKPMRVDTLEDAQRQLRLKLELKYSSLPKTKPKLAPLDLVRISKLERNKFKRGYKPRFSTELYQIFLVHTHLPEPLYTLKNLWNTEYIKGRFLEQELRKVTLSLTHHIRKVLKKEGSMVTVNFLSLPEKVTATIHEKNIVP